MAQRPESKPYIYVSNPLIVEQGFNYVVTYFISNIGMKDSLIYSSFGLKQLGAARCESVTSVYESVLADFWLRYINEVISLSLGAGSKDYMKVETSHN